MSKTPQSENASPVLHLARSVALPPLLTGWQTT